MAWVKKHFGEPVGCFQVPAALFLVVESECFNLRGGLKSTGSGGGDDIVAFCARGPGPSACFDEMPARPSLGTSVSLPVLISTASSVPRQRPSKSREARNGRARGQWLSMQRRNCFSITSPQTVWSQRLGQPGCITGGSVLHPTGRDENTRRRKARPKFLKILSSKSTCSVVS